MLKNNTLDIKMNMNSKVWLALTEFSQSADIDFALRLGATWKAE